MSARWFPDDMPAPMADRDTQAWWEAAAQERLVVQECSDCRRLRHPPGPLCPGCRSSQFGWRKLSGRGQVYTYTVVHRPASARQADQLPFIIAAIELDDAEGIRMVSNLVEIEPDDVKVGTPVRVVWEKMSSELSIPRFRPV